MRAAADSPTIGVSCGHRVPREPVRVGPRKLYRCEECGELKMSGTRSTGERAFDFLLELRDEISSRELVVDVDERVPAHGLAVSEAFGATVRRVAGSPGR
jgi:uncharacterized Zn finger protein